MPRTNCFFVTSTGTEIGKTFVSTKIIDYFLQQSLRIEPLKPILSGFDKKNIKESDSGKLLISCKKKVSLSNISKMTPWLYENPIAPSLAAKYENKKLIYSDVQKWCKEKKKNSKSDFLLFEGAGGLMVPIERKKNFLDLFKSLKIPVILVVGSYLGTISHTLSALENLCNYNIRVINIIFNEGVKKNKNNDQNLELLKKSLKYKVLVRELSYNSVYHNKQIQKIAKDILRFFT